MDNSGSFNYTYSALQQQEIKNIRSKYAPPEENKLETLRRLDRRVTQKAQAWAIAVGIIGTLLLGLGMSLAMTELGSALGGFAVAAAMLVGLPGIALTALAYPVYKRIEKRERERVAPEIMRLSDELLK